jgi:phenylacetate-CoA ligase
MRRIEKITGRTDDMIILRGVNLFPTQIEEIVLKVPALTPHFQCVLTRAGNMDAMTVTIERAEHATAAEAAAAADHQRPRVKRTIGVTVGVEVKEPFEIERSVGKMRRIVDNRAR